MSGLPRSVLKWIQGLDLTYQINNPKWDLCNGFLIAEIFSWYYPEDINILSFNNGQALDSKMSNWALIKKFIVNKQLNIQNELIDGTLHCKEGAAILLIENMYQLLTNRPVQKAQLKYEIDLTDWPYQQQLPYHARSTASKSIKNNVRSTELLTDPNLKYNAGKAEAIISDHIDHRRAERDHSPKRFSVKKTLAEKCIRRPVPDARQSSDLSYDIYLPESNVKETKSSIVGIESETALTDNKSVSEKHYKEIRVNQEAYNVNLGTVN